MTKVLPLFVTLLSLATPFGKASDAPEWESPEIFQVNREPPHSFFTRCSGNDSAGQNHSSSSLYKSLNGNWNFHWSPTPEARPVGFEETNYDVAVIPISVVDSDGRLVYESNHEVTCSVSGPARLLASRDASENHRDNKARVNHGRLVAYVQALAGEGTAEVVVTAPGLALATVTLHISR